MSDSQDKFEFGKDFQWQILRYTLNDKSGYKILRLYTHTYFDLIYQRVIAFAIQRFFKRNKRIPSEASILNEELRKVFKLRDWVQSFTEDDRAKIKKRVRSLYKNNAKDGDEILHQCKQFASFIELKKTLEEIDPSDFANYGSYSRKIQNAINLSMELDDEKGSFIVAAHQSRMEDRRMTSDIIPTPFKQLNRLTNANGFEKGSVIVFIDRPKEGKTALLLNVARTYVQSPGRVMIGPYRKNKKVLYIDLENGQRAITTRMDQSVLAVTKKEILRGEHDRRLAKTYRRYKRMGGELYIRRLPSGSTTDDFQMVMDDVYNEYGIKFEVAVVDYAMIMGCTTGAKDDFGRISQAYLDLKNWAERNALDVVFTGHHVVRPAFERRSSRYRADDTAKCIDINRHVDAMYGLQQNKTEKEAGILRMEVIEQRDGYPTGRVIFKFDMNTQRISELNPKKLKRYNKLYYDKNKKDE